MNSTVEGSSDLKTPTANGILLHRGQCRCGCANLYAGTRGGELLIRES
jgi:hypothetical protein